MAGRKMTMPGWWRPVLAVPGWWRPGRAGLVVVWRWWRGGRWCGWCRGGRLAGCMRRRGGWGSGWRGGRGWMRPMWGGRWRRRGRLSSIVRSLPARAGRSWRRGWVRWRRGCRRRGWWRGGFVFPGQGAQRAGMGAELYAASPVFAAVFDEACGLLEAELGVPVADVVLGRGGDGDGGPGGGGAGRADQTVFAQAGLFAVQAGLVAVLAACGVVPDAVAGHSVGEVAAAYAAGVLSLADACALVAARGKLMQALPGGGAMTAVQASEAEVAAALDGLDGVSVAAVNGPGSVVISGDTEIVDRVAGGFGEQGRRVRRLRVSHAFHSDRMEPVLAELGRVAGTLDHAVPRVPWACGLTGGLVTSPEPGYWVAAAREPVRFADAVVTLAGQGVSVFVEIGPDGTLSALGPDALGVSGGPDALPGGGPGSGGDGGAGGGGAVFVPVLRAGRAAPAAVTSALAGLHVRGVGVDWAAVLGRGRRVDLPTYAFQHDRYWPAAPQVRAGDVAAAGLGVAGHPLLGAMVTLAGGGGLVLTGRLSVAAQPWLADHVVGGVVLLPGTAFVELAICAGDAAGCGRVGELIVEAPLALPARGGVRVQVLVAEPDEAGRRELAVYSRAGDGGGAELWVRHASGLLAPAGEPGAELEAGELAV